MNRFMATSRSRNLSAVVSKKSPRFDMDEMHCLGVQEIDDSSCLEGNNNSAHSAIASIVYIWE